MVQLVNVLFIRDSHVNDDNASNGLMRPSCLTHTAAGSGRSVSQGLGLVFLCTD